MKFWRKNISLIIAALLLTIFLLTPSLILTSCPKGLVNDPFPGRCGLYTDKDQNQICDLSEVTATTIEGLPRDFNLSFGLPVGVFVFLMILTIVFLFSKTKPPYRYLILATGLLVGFFSFKNVCPIAFLQFLLIFKDKAVLNLFLFLLFLLPIMLAVLFGRVFCGWVCPIGAVQEFLFRIPRWVKINLPNLTQKLPLAARYLPLLVLAILGFGVVKSGKTLFCLLDPFAFLFGFSRSLVLLGALLILFLISLFVFRPFCLFVCPLGAIFFSLSGISVWQIKRNKRLCSKCKLCIQKCLIGAIDKKLKIDQKHCLRCQECLVCCPKKALSFKS